jgi:hypothetical protein
LPTLVSRPRALLVALAAAILTTGVLVPPVAAHPEPKGLDAFMRAVGHVESGGRYDAVNPVSGAYGKYQIMPFNWPVWAKAILGDANAEQSPENQEKVARHRFVHLHHWLGSWPRVAYWWLTGKTTAVEQWSVYARRYVDNVMALAGGKGWKPAPETLKAWSAKGAPAAPKAAAAPKAPLHTSEGDPSIKWTGRWGRAAHAGYAGGSVAWATAARSSATLVFDGRSIAWLGPVGPTRGSARVYIDDVLVATVSQHGRSYEPQRTLYTRDFGTSGRHTIRIVVAGTPGHPMVAIDTLIVGY